jgi:hypothetical protein
MGGFRLEFLGQFQVRFAVAQLLHFAVRPEQTEICDDDEFRVHKWLGKSAVGKMSLGLVLARPFRNPQARHLTSSFRQDLDGDVSAKEPPRGHFFPYGTIFRLLTEVNWFVSSRLLRTRRRARLRTSIGWFDLTVLSSHDWSFCRSQARSRSYPMLFAHRAGQKNQKHSQHRKGRELF